jgi:TRAP-type uncharacterized transport system fused permease subunit
MGMPTPNVYILTAVLTGPMLASLGVDKMAGNLFLVYFAALSAMTPPVAVAAYAAAPIADANPLQVGFTAVRVCIAAFIVPFAFVYGPELLLNGPVWAIALNFITAAVGVVLLAASLEGWLKGPLAWHARLLLAAASLALIAPGVLAAAIGVSLTSAALATNWLAQRSIARPSL